MKHSVIPEDRATITQPVFFGACAKDYVCVPALNRLGTEKYCTNLTQKEYDADHWVCFSHADQLNKDLLAWILDVVEA